MNALSKITTEGTPTLVNERYIIERLIGIGRWTHFTDFDIPLTEEEARSRFFAFLGVIDSKQCKDYRLAIRREFSVEIVGGL